MRLSPAGDVLYVTGSGQEGQPGNIEVFTLVAGVATYTGSVSAGNGPFGIAINPAGTFLYVANFDDNSISSFSVGSGGALTSLGSPIGETFNAPVALLVDNSGKYLYVANESSTNLAAFAIDSGGGLTLITTSPFATGSEPSFIASDPTGNFLFVSNQAVGKASIQSFSLDGSTGTLASVASYGLANPATSIAVTP